jgi:hypothetical protein
MESASTRKESSTWLAVSREVRVAIGLAKWSHDPRAGASLLPRPDSQFQRNFFAAT